MKRKYLIWMVTLLLVLAGTVWAEETEGAEEPAWSGKLGLSYLATTGNSETSSFGAAFELKRQPRPWGMEIGGSFQRAKDESVVTAERYWLSGRATRSLGEVWELFAGLSFEQNEFEGFELRTIVEAGASWKVVRGPKHFLTFDGGLTWTDEDVVEPDEDLDYLGGLLGLAYEWKLSETASFTQKVAYYPNFDDSGDWRLKSETALSAQLLKALALQLSFELRFRNQPLDAADDTDTTTKASVVWSF